MLTAKRIIRRILLVLAALYLLLCSALYFFQEAFIFLPDKLDKNYRFSFDHIFEEINIKTPGGNTLNGLLFPADGAKGLVFYLHGNAGALNRWGTVAKRYTGLGYSVFILDYPGYGKSGGAIRSRQQLFDAVQAAYDAMKTRYREDGITVLGYSIGSGIAAHLAATNHPARLILQAPYYSLGDMMRHRFAIIPAFLLKYKINTGEYLAQCRMPVALFHGDADEVIYYGSSLKLKETLKPGDTLITLKGAGHNGMTDNPDYVSAIGQVLE